MYFIIALPFYNCPPPQKGRKRAFLPNTAQWTLYRERPAENNYLFYYCPPLLLVTHGYEQGTMDWWVKRSLLCRRLIREESLLEAGAEVGRLLGSFRRTVSLILHPDKTPGLGKDLQQCFNNAIEVIQNDAMAQNLFKGGYDLVDQQVAYRTPAVFETRYICRSWRWHGGLCKGRWVKAMLV